MSHYAKLGSLDSDGNREVLGVIVVDDEWDEGPGKSEADGIALCIDIQGGTEENWKKTSRNTDSGIHVDPDTREPDAGTPLRKNYAGIGMLYDESRDAFYNPNPFPSWTLQEDTCRWESPAGPRPGSVDGSIQDLKKHWDETNLKWVGAEDYKAGLADGTITEAINGG